MDHALSAEDTAVRETHIFSFRGRLLSLFLTRVSSFVARYRQVCRQVWKKHRSIFILLLLLLLLSSSSSSSFAYAIPRGRLESIFADQTFVSRQIVAAISCRRSGNRCSVARYNFKPPPKRNKEPTIIGAPYSGINARHGEKRERETRSGTESRLRRDGNESGGGLLNAAGGKVLPHFSAGGI